MHVRRAASADIEALNTIELEGDALHARRAPQVFQVPAHVGHRHAYWAKILRGRNNTILVAEEAGVVVGIVQVAVRISPRLPMLRRRRFGYVSDLVVSRRWRRRGVGKRLMAAAARWLKQRRVTVVELNVWSFNRNAMEFYRRLGYHFVSHRMGKAIT